MKLNGRPQVSQTIESWCCRGAFSTHATAPRTSPAAIYSWPFDGTDEAKEPSDVLGYGIHVRYRRTAARHRDRKFIRVKPPYCDDIALSGIRDACESGAYYYLSQATLLQSVDRVPRAACQAQTSIPCAGRDRGRRGGWWATLASQTSATLSPETGADPR